MNHKRGRPKNRRGGCLMCKRHKVNGAKTWEFSRGFSKLRKEFLATLDLKGAA